MPHAEWLKNCAPKECWKCIDEGTVCPLDEAIPCSPDCPEINPETGEPSMSEACRNCDAIAK